MNSAIKDLRYAFRQLLRTPGFAITAILTLALGIGANTAIFSLLDQALLRPLPVSAPGSLFYLQDTEGVWQGSTSDNGGDIHAYFSYPMYKRLRDQAKPFEGLIATAPVDIGFVRNGSARLMRVELVSGNYFTVLGVPAALGRVFTQSEDVVPNANPVLVLSYDYWKNTLGADPSIVGSTVALNGQPFQIVGIASQGFHSAVWGETPAGFSPMSNLPVLTPNRRADRLTDQTDKWMNILGRLKPGISRQEAEVDVNPLWHALRADEMEKLGTKSAKFTSRFLGDHLKIMNGSRGFSYQRDNFQKPLLAVMAMSLLVLLIASINVASLLLVRSAGRIREFSLRFALGAETGRVAQQLLIEGLLIGIAGGAAGMLLAPIAIRSLLARLAGDTGQVAFTADIDTRLLLFNFVIAILVSVLFSLAPLFQLRNPNLTLALRQQSGTSTGSMLRFRRAVVCLQIGLSVLLLVAAGLFARTMQKLHSVNVGFDTTHLVTFHIDATLAGYKPDAIPLVYQRVLESLQAIPGVQSVAASDNPILTGDAGGGSVTVTGYVAPPDTDSVVSASEVNASYFDALKIPLVAGRVFSETDTIDHPMVSVVNESFAKIYCGTPQSCIGRIATPPTGPNHPKAQIIGVVADAHQRGVREPVDPSIWVAMRQANLPEGIYLYVRTAQDPAQQMNAIRHAMHDVNAGLAIDNMRTMDAQIDDLLSNDSMIALLAIVFGALATLLAGVGLYGVLAYSTSQRTREIGLRIALGSTRSAVASLILMDLLKLAAIGIAVAIPTAFALSRLIQAQLFGVSTADPSILVSVALLITIVALVAALIPARRAASIPPNIALRTE